jgi:hypothetical protein
MTGAERRAFLEAGFHLFAPKSEQVFVFAEERGWRGGLGGLGGSDGH